jgi:hypothetical protein
MLFLAAADSDLLAFLREVDGLLPGCPTLIAHAEADLDAHGCGKKALAYNLCHLARMRRIKEAAVKSDDEGKRAQAA